MTAARKLPLDACHRKLGAHMGTFGEWEVPLYYSSVIEEHECVRTCVGIFDISHMGEIFFEGPKAAQALNFLVTNQIDKLTDGKALYSPVCNEAGGIVDDVVVYRIHSEKYLVVVNAANITKDDEWFRAHNPSGALISNRSDEFGLLSIQGPKSLGLLKGILSEPLELIKYYSVIPISSRWKNALIARTGYTGELGFELFLGPEDLDVAYLEILERGKTFGIQPAGFGARDTLRLEAGMLLYGQDMNDTTTPLEAGLERTLAFEKDFVGKEALVKQRQKGASTQMAGFEMIGHGLARHGYPVVKNGKEIGCVTSGSFSPTLKKNIGLAYLPPADCKIGTEINIQIRQNAIKAKIIPTPFYKRPKSN